MSEHLVEFAIDSWQGPFPTDVVDQAIDALEAGKVVYLPQLSFPLQEAEFEYLSSNTVDAKSKNVRYDINTDRLGGTALPAPQRLGLQALMCRFADNSRLLVEQLFSHYRGHLSQARTSFRPVEAQGRPSSYRKDDTRLHVDAFPATPTGGKRILRVFTNVNPNGLPRHWRVGEPFDRVVEQFLPRLPKPNWLVAKLLQIVRLTRGQRTAYDHYMHQLHDAMKADLEYQKHASQEDVYFLPGSTWLVFSDQVSHAAISGQFMFEQTFYLPVKSMLYEQRSPLKVLERRVGCSLV